MKRIYAVTLDDEVPLSEDASSEIKELAFWLYEELGKFNIPITCVDDEQNIDSQGLIKNELYDIEYKNKYIYRFSSDMNPKIDYRMFEPFILNDRTFCFTINDGTISDGEIMVILERILKILKLDYKFNIDSVTYEEGNIKNRFLAINELANPKKIKKEKKRVKLQIKPSAIV